MVVPDEVPPEPPEDDVPLELLPLDDDPADDEAEPAVPLPDEDVFLDVVLAFLGFLAAASASSARVTVAAATARPARPVKAARRVISRGSGSDALGLNGIPCSFHRRGKSAV